MSWVVTFVLLNLSVPDGMSAKFTARFDDLETCQMFLEDADEEEIRVLSACQPEVTTP